MFRLRTFVLMGIALLVVSTRGNAGPILFSATITGGQELPPNMSRGFGIANFLLDLDAPNPYLTYDMLLIRLDLTGSQSDFPHDDVVAAHIHAPAPLGVNAGIVFGFFGTPFNDTNPPDLVMMPDSIQGGRIMGKWDYLEGNSTTLAEQLPHLLAGNAYINFHTLQYPDGEIRGQITPITPIPEPSTLMLLGIGAAGLSRRCWRRH